MMRTILAVIAILLLVGCAHGNRYQPLYDELSAKKGNATYDDMLQRFGTPANVAQGDRIFVATWEKMAQDDVSALWETERLTLTFDRESKKMVGWRHVKY